MIERICSAQTDLAGFEANLLHPVKAIAAARLRTSVPSSGCSLASLVSPDKNARNSRLKRWLATSCLLLYEINNDMDLVEQAVWPLQRTNQRRRIMCVVRWIQLALTDPCLISFSGTIAHWIRSFAPTRSSVLRDGLPSWHLHPRLGPGTAPQMGQSRI